MHKSCGRIDIKAGRLVEFAFGADQGSGRRAETAGRRCDVRNLARGASRPERVCRSRRSEESGAAAAHLDRGAERLLLQLEAEFSDVLLERRPATMHIPCRRVEGTAPVPWNKRPGQRVGVGDTQTDAEGWTKHVLTHKREACRRHAKPLAKERTKPRVRSPRPTGLIRGLVRLSLYVRVHAANSVSEKRK